MSGSGRGEELEKKKLFWWYLCPLFQQPNHWLPRNNPFSVSTEELFAKDDSQTGKAMESLLGRGKYQSESHFTT